jgi:hypothetical protein
MQNIEIVKLKNSNNKENNTIQSKSEVINSSYMNNSINSDLQ